MAQRPFLDLSQEEQIQALEGLGRAALAEFGVEPRSITPLVHAENTTFCVESDQGKFCLRISRPGYQSTAAIQSEIQLLAALREEDFPVPSPWQARLVTAEGPGVPEARDCVLFGWLEGEVVRQEAPMSLGQASQLGSLMARLHDFTSRWTIPDGFDRHRLHAWADSADRVRRIDTPIEGLSETDRQLLIETDDAMGALFRRLEKTPDQYGLIHADLHRGNVLFTADGINLIDFDDAGWVFFVFDFAAALAYEMLRPDFPEVRDAMFEGYARIRSLPPQTEALLPDFLRGRFAGIAQWMLERLDNPYFREHAPKYATDFCDRIRRVEGGSF